MTSVKTKMRPSTVEGKAGTIYYQIIHNRVLRQLRTDYKVFSSEWDSARGSIITHGADSERLAALLSVRKRITWDMKRLNAIVSEFDRRNRPYTADDVADAFVNRLHKHAFRDFMQAVIEQLKSLGRDRTAENYITTLNSFMQFRNNEDLLPEDITSDLMMRYEAYLTVRGLSRNAISFYMRILRAVYNRAVEQSLTVQQMPFKHVYTGIDKTVKRAIPFAAIKRIKDLDLSGQPSLDFARDMFLFSFYTRGMSFIDMAYLRKRDLKNGIISYRRRKTGQQLYVKWERCMQDIADKYEHGAGSHRSASGSPYLLPIIKHPFDDGGTQYRRILQQVNKSLKIIAKAVGLDVALTMYAARHSWASVARMKRVPISVISEGLGHDSETTTQIYLASLDTSVIDKANRLVLKGL